MSTMEISNLTKEKLKKMFLDGKRFDSRDLLEFRNIKVTYDVSNKAEGSARVKLGKTEVIAGVKMQVGEPYPDSLDKGNLMVSGDLLPLASPRFESGPPGFEAIELPRLIDRAIRAAELIDLKKLVIKEGEKVWTVIIDLYPINDDGNLIDAASIAALAALRKSFLPELDKDGRIDYDKKMTKKLPLEEDTLPLSLSFFKLGDSLILDPTREEEEACDTRITFGISEWKGQHMLNSCQKKGESPLTKEDIGKVMDIIPEKFDELSKKLKNYI
ncbi:exosome complex protein Rrp42 [Candidatus Pacearchaeota archaeon]|nr:exosome complex protein Rrp42 [Candidatus Pacearchaeota archaeon]